MAFWEALLTYNEILFAYFQLLSMVNKIDVKWPSFWLAWTEWLDLFKLDFDIQIPNIPTMDYRVYFMIVTVLLPLTCCFIFLLFFKRKRVVLWYFFVMAGTGLMAAGLLTLYLPFVGTIASVNSSTIAIVGGVLVGIMLCIWAASRGRTAYNTKRGRVAPVSDQDEEAARIQAVLESSGTVADLTQYKEPPKKTVMYNLIVCSSWMGTAACGVFTLGWMQVNNTQLSTLSSLGSIVGRMFLGGAFIIFVYWIIMNTKKGRRFLDRTKATLRAGFLRIFLFILMIIYIPIVNTLVQSIVCITKECPAGKAFPKSGLLYTPSAVTYTREMDICEDCNFLDGCALTNELCPKVTDSRLAADLQLSCSEIGPFMWPVSGLIFIGFAVGVPVLLYLMIKKHTTYLNQVQVATGKFHGDEHSEEDQWEDNLKLTKNSAKSLYMAFERRYRYYKLFITIHKFFVVFMTIILLYFPSTLSIVMFIIHMIFVIVSIKTQPYIAQAQDYLSTASALCLAISTFMAILLAYDFVIPDIVMYIVLGGNIVLPLLAAIVGFVVSRKQQSKSSDVQKTLTMSEKEKLVTLDRSINEFSLKTMTNYFLILGILAFFAATAIFVGVMYADAQTKSTSYDFVPSVNTLSETEYEKELRKFQFVEYGNWAKFTENCCCRQGEESETNRAALVENWWCKNEYIKLRLRKQRVFDYSQAEAEDQSTVQSGIPLRPFCSRKFSPGVCTPRWVKLDQAEDQSTKVMTGVVYQGYIEPAICDAGNWTGPESFKDKSSIERQFLW